MPVPTYDQLFNPTLKAVHQLGGSASTSEMEDKVAENLKLSEKDINEIHRGSTTKLSYRLAWARNYLKRIGILENSNRGVWSLTQKGKRVSQVDKEKVKREVRIKSNLNPVTEGIREDNENKWQEGMIKQLLMLSPSSFEKLCQRVLREAGFIKVEVTGKTGDGGIDGTGLVKMNGLLSFNIIFQCKRYTGSVSSSQIRDFRGAMDGRADKGLFITTGSFTRDARIEATRPGAIHIDILDGEDLVEKMKELGLGVKIVMQENIQIDTEWFKGF